MRGTINATPVRASASGASRGIAIRQALFLNLRQTGGPARQTVMVKRRLRNTLQSSFHIGSFYIFDMHTIHQSSMNYIDINETKNLSLNTSELASVTY